MQLQKYNINTLGSTHKIRCGQILRKKEWWSRRRYRAQRHKIHKFKFIMTHIQLEITQIQYKYTGSASEIWCKQILQKTKEWQLRRSWTQRHAFSVSMASDILPLIYCTISNFTHTICNYTNTKQSHKYKFCTQKSGG